DLVPVLVDADPRNWCMDVRQVGAMITDRTRVILAVHTYGHPVDMDALTELARNHNLLILEDAAEAHGAEYLARRDHGSGTWRRCGALGDLSTFSFYANKPVTTGEGGMVLTRDADQAAHLRSLRNLSFGANQRFEHAELGFNFRLTNLQAALGLAQVERIDEIVERKRWIGASYQARLGDVAGLQLPVEEAWARQVYWMYGVVLDELTGLDALEFARRLQDRGVQTRPFFLGMHQQPALLQRGLFEGQRFPVTERLARQGLYLPSGLSLTEEQIDTVCAAVREALA
ncbi:MAG: DegT/DnrJ/EryC1/StrS family aminotransferase, partial [Chloroflexota bacterium]